MGKSRPLQLQALVEKFLEARAERYRPNTLRAYRADLAALSAACPGAAAAVTTEQLRRFLKAAAPCSPATRARRLAVLRSLFEWAQRQGLVATDPTRPLDAVRVPQRQPRPLTEAQVEALLAAVSRQAVTYRLLFGLLYETGLRIGEALGVHAEHVFLNDVDGGFVRVLGKGGGERVVPLIDAPRSLRRLRTLLKRQQLGPIFHGDLRRGGRLDVPLDYSCALEQFERCVARARAAQPQLFARETEPITMHRIRHTYASLRLRDGVSVTAVRKLMGHKNLQTTMVYADHDLRSLQRELVEARRRRQVAGPASQPALKKSPSKRPRLASRRTPPLAPVPRVMRVELYLRVENNNKFVRGKTRARQEIEDYLLRRYQMQKPRADGWEYLLAIPYESDAALDEAVEDILAEAAQIADCRHCFTEADVRSLDDPDRSW